MSELKPCPLCGGKAKIEISRHGSKQYDFCEIYCLSCHATVRYGIDVEYSAKDKAIEAWNRRIKL